MSSHVPLPRERHSKSKLFVTLSSLGSKKKEHLKCITSHPFNHRCTIIAPNSLDIGQLMKAHMGCYYRATLKLSDLIDPAFIAAFVKNNTLLALSPGRIDTDDVFAIDGNGTLILNVCKDTYESLGIVGTQAKIPLERGSRFVIKIDLKAACMVPEKKYYQRIKAGFDTVLNEGIEFLIGFYDSETGGALNFDVPGATQCLPTVEEHMVAEALVPQLLELLAAKDKAEEDWIECAQEVFEWVGLATLGSSLVVGTRADPEVCEYVVSEPYTRANLRIVSVSGMLSPMAISAVAHKLATQASTQDAAECGTFLCVWGHEDAPVSWTSSEHGYLTSGEHMYVEVFAPQSDRCAIFQACGPWDTHS
ncbi:hypothetical protein IWW39_000737 [Coemansia spiralis]|uniref:Uncharacterized protein n=1 Tax=Coemansia spiralis TaxID=417178 RepID=A0A9W8GPA6_9FUNG|nr:hypothetical protein IWW39_000737 [Coemansia spiralis]